MNNTQFSEATQINTEKRLIAALISLLTTDNYKPADVLAAYNELGDSADYLKWKGKIYSSAPDVAITGDGTGAEAVASINKGILSSVAVTVPGLGYTFAEVEFSGGGGGGAAAHALIDGSGDSITSIVVDNNSLIAKLVVKDADLDADFAAL